jgi:hypothetical protein
VVAKSSPTFGNVPHPWALTIVKQEANVIMNICRSQEVGEGGFVHLLLKSGTDLPLISR